MTRKRNLSRNQLAVIRTRLAYCRTFLAAVTLAVAIAASVASVAHSETIWTQSCGSHAGLYFCTEYQMNIPLPKARPIIPCTTDSDCQSKNGGDGYMGPCDTDSDDYCDSYHAPAINRLRAD